MTTAEKIQHIAQNAIPLPECPIKKPHAVAARVALHNAIEKLVNEIRQECQQATPLVGKPGPTEFKDY